MNEILAKAVLMRFRIGEYLDESWLLHHAGATLELLDEMVTVGYLTKKLKDTSDFMSDNRYAITISGYQFSQK